MSPLIRPLLVLSRCFFRLCTFSVILGIGYYLRLNVELLFCRNAFGFVKPVLLIASGVTTTLM